MAQRACAQQIRAKITIRVGRGLWSKLPRTSAAAVARRSSSRESARTGGVRARATNVVRGGAVSRDGLSKQLQVDELPSRVLAGKLSWLARAARKNLSRATLLDPPPRGPRRAGPHSEPVTKETSDGCRRPHSHRPETRRPPRSPRRRQRRASGGWRWPSTATTWAFACARSRRRATGSAASTSCCGSHRRWASRCSCTRSRTCSACPRPFCLGSPSLWRPAYVGNGRSKPRSPRCWSARRGTRCWPSTAS
jgi:hypothetical protein